MASIFVTKHVNKYSSQKLLVRLSLQNKADLCRGCCREVVSVVVVTNEKNNRLHLVTTVSFNMKMISRIADSV